MVTDQQELQLTINVAISTFFRGNPVVPRVSVFAREQKISCWFDSGWGCQRPETIMVSGFFFAGKCSKKIYSHITLDYIKEKNVC